VGGAMCRAVTMDTICPKITTYLNATLERIFLEQGTA